ncbi:MAG: PorP/SprF family type IX secretion system membrane protein [Ginsengibacter sp.]|jgi:type IX secretion system PorP/SprF family membrane protein
MRFYFKIFFFLICCGSVRMSYAQDINFSQFYELPMLRNPALAGIFEGDIRVTAGYRNQWQSVTTPYQTQALGMEFKTSLGENSYDFLTLGLQMTNDRAGDSKLSKIQVLPVLNFHKSVNGDRDTYISAGIMAGLVQQRFDPSKLQFDDQFVNGSFSATNSTQQVFTSTSITYWDISVGLSYSSIASNDIRYYVGVGLFHFTKPKVAFIPNNDIKLNPKWTINVGLSAPTGDNDRLILYGDYFVQGGYKQVQGGFLYSHDLIAYDEVEKIAISAGSFYRWNDAVIPVLKFDYFNWGLGVSYDINVSKLSSASQMRGGLELTLSYKAYLNIMNTSLNKVRCVQF